MALDTPQIGTRSSRNRRRLSSAKKRWQSAFRRCIWRIIGAIEENRRTRCERKQHGTRRGMEEVRRGRPRGARAAGVRVHRLHLGQQDGARMRRRRNRAGRGAWLPPARRGGTRGPRAASRRQGVGAGARQGAHLGAPGLGAACGGLQHPGRAHRLPAPRPQAKPVLGEQRPGAPRHALLRWHQELPVGHAAACAARRDCQDGRHRGRGERGRGRGRPRVLRDRPAHPPGGQADGQEGERGRGRRGPGHPDREPPAGHREGRG